MSILSSNHPVENQVSNSISRFLSDFQVIRIFRACGCAKAKGISIDFLFAYILGNAFRSSSFYTQQRMQELQGCFSKNTYYRFLANPHVNWLHFTTRLAVRIIEQFIINFLCLDDTIFNNKNTQKFFHVFLLSILFPP